MLERRKAIILRAVVRDYVRNGRPVGSESLGRRHRLKVSAATIRNDMAVLEELGYLTQPYTSAGRIPTDLGYRWFVDAWTDPWPPLPPGERDTIEGMMRQEYRAIEDALDSTSHVLSEVTEATAVVVAPPTRKNLLRRLELIRRHDGRVTLLLIAQSGVVEQSIVDLGPCRDDQLDELSSQLSAELQGVAFSDLATAIGDGTESGSDRAKIAGEIAMMFAERPPEKIFRGGTANILTPEKFPDMSVAHEVIEALEHPSTLAALVEAARRAGSVLVFIGGEVPVEQMQACAVVFCRYEAGGDRHGTLGVVGPTRMDYPHTISAVETVSHSLSELLTSG